MVFKGSVMSGSMRKTVGREGGRGVDCYTGSAVFHCMGLRQCIRPIMNSLPLAYSPYFIHSGWSFKQCWCCGVLPVTLGMHFAFSVFFFFLFGAGPPQWWFALEQAPASAEIVACPKAHSVKVSTTFPPRCHSPWGTSSLLMPKYMLTTKYKYLLHYKIMRRPSFARKWDFLCH